MAQAGVQAGLVEENQPPSGAVSIFPLCPVLEVTKRVCIPHYWSPGFLQPSVNLASSPAKGTLVPGSQIWGALYGAQTSHSPGMVSVHVIPLLFLSPFPRAQVPTRSVLFPSYPVLCESFLQLWLYIDDSPPGSSIPGILKKARRQEHWSGLPFPSPKLNYTPIQNKN